MPLSPPPATANTYPPQSPAPKDPPSIPVELLAAYAIGASEADEREFSFYAKQFDGQLVFSGIFSAIVVQLVPQTYPLLQTDSPGASAIIMNVGFFGALILSLCTVIMALQCRAWLDGYEAFRLSACDPAKNSREVLAAACRLREYRYQGLTKFHVLFAARSSGPMMIYGAFLLFFVGLIVLLLSANKPIAIAAITFLGLFLCGHLITTIVPCFRPDAPYKTPMSGFIVAWYHGFRLGKPPSQELVDGVEREEVEGLGANLDKDILAWLARNGSSNVVRELAERELLSRQGKGNLEA
ncbi:hypothetical protein MIND_00573400 [Mycena indigotica]|uniref:DUF6535 domain-containing protein n=1 Tax=Mycena indigotica TaxID=2126181 RepID=A0A8H6SRL9_9AGAR|nr:uncharacterized protein MIND_00573400 [Mycena indigotica]KAF7303446.1 hypothetical protein MIND_00573400 [Mycena indigotica]